MKVSFLRVGSIVIFFLAIIFFIVAGPAADYFLDSSSIGVFGKYKNTEIGFRNEDFNTIVAKIRSNDPENTSEFESLYQGFNCSIVALNAEDKAQQAGYVPSSNLINKAIAKVTEPGTFFSKEVYDTRYPRISVQERTSILKSERDKLFTNANKLLTGLRYVRDVFGTSDNMQLNSIVLKLSGEVAACGYSYADVVQQLLLDMTGDIYAIPYGVKTSPAEEKFLAEFGAEKHSFDIAAFETSSLPREETIKFLNDNKSLFNKYNLSVISFEKESEAKDALKKIKDGESTFDDAFLLGIRNYSASQGKSTLEYEYQLEQTIDSNSALKKVLALNKDEYSDVVKTEEVYSFFRCDGEKTEADISSDEIINVASNYIAANKNEMLTDYWNEQANKLYEAAKTGDFDKACVDFKAEKVSVPAFPLNFNDSPIAETIPSSIYQLSRASSDENVLKTMFSLKNVNDVSSPITYGHNIMVMKLTGIQKDTVTDEAKTKAQESATSFDFYSSLISILKGDKVRDNFQEAYQKIQEKNNNF